MKEILENPTIVILLTILILAYFLNKKMNQNHELQRINTLGKCKPKKNKLIFKIFKNVEQKERGFNYKMDKKVVVYSIL